MRLDYTLPFALSCLAVLAGLVILLGTGLLRFGAFLLRRPRPSSKLTLAAAMALLAAGGICGLATLRIKGATVAHAAVDLAMTQAPRPPRDFHRTIPVPAPYVLLAGDLHCHIHPPDWSEHVARRLPETVELARAEGLDFVSIIPHVFSGRRAGIGKMIEELQRRIDARPADGLILDVGVEYVDPTGHFGMVFGDIPGALAATAKSTRPEAFVNAFADRGGLLIVHHPLLGPIPSRFPLANIDISWQPFTGSPPFRPEIAAVDARADGYEAANLFVSAVRDRFLLRDTQRSTQGVLRVLDREIVRRGRRMTPVGGTDSHSFHLRPMTFLLAETRSREGIRDAIRAGRTCVVHPAACTFEARVKGGSFAPVGSSVLGVRSVEVRATGSRIAVYRDGMEVAAPASGQVVSVDVEDECTVLRAVVDGGYGAPVYVNCPFASARR